MSLIELMIGVTIGLLVVGGVTTIYISLINNSSQTLKMSKLTNSLSTLNSIMINDLRRTGYWDGTNLNDIAANPFNQVGTTALEVHSTADFTDMSSYADVGTTGIGECVVYTYDETHDDDDDGGVSATVDDNEKFGFRLRDDGGVGVIDIRTQGDTINTCDDEVGATWTEITDKKLIDISLLTFNMANSSCLNTSVTDGFDDDTNGATTDEDEEDCYLVAPANTIVTNDLTLETREVTITLKGNLITDPNVQVVQTNTVRIRNDIVRTQ